jgi:cell division protein FtsB
MEQTSDAERKRIADLETKVMELQQQKADAEKAVSEVKASEAKKDEIIRGYHDEKRSALEITGPKVHEFFNMLSADEAAQPYQAEHKEMTTWASNMCKDENPTASLKIGRVLVTASVRDKRQRDRIETLEAGAADVQALAKERDEARAEVETLRQKNTALTEECTVKQSAIEKFALEMKKYEALGQTHPTVKTHQFSQLIEREKPPASMGIETKEESSTPVSEQRPAFTLTDWIENQTSHMTGEQSMLYREKSAYTSLLPSSLANLQ